VNLTKSKCHKIRSKRAARSWRGLQRKKAVWQAFVNAQRDIIGNSTKNQEATKTSDDKNF